MAGQVEPALSRACAVLRRILVQRSRRQRDEPPGEPRRLPGTRAHVPTRGHRGGFHPRGDPARCLRDPAAELAAHDHERREIATAHDEVKTNLPGSEARLRSKMPDLLLQELHGLMLARFAVRRLIHEAAGSVGEDPDRLSFLHAVRVVGRRTIHLRASLRSGGNPLKRDILEERAISSRGQVKRKMSTFGYRASKEFTNPGVTRTVNNKTDGFSACPPSGRF